MFTNINIIGDKGVYNYIIEYSNKDNSSIESIEYIPNSDGVFVYNKEEVDKYKNHGNHWDIYSSIKDKEVFGKNLPAAWVRVYFPEFSVDTYNPGTLYMLSLCTWIKGKKIDFGSYLISRSDALACASPKTFMSHQYYEYFDVLIPDIYDMLYSSDWEKFRNDILNYSCENNSTEAILYASLHTVSKESNGVYIKDGCTGGQNSLRLTSGDKGDLQLILKANIDEHLTSEPGFDLELKYNKNYASLYEYMRQTYNISKGSKLIYSLVIGDENNLYANLQVTTDFSDNISANHTFYKSEIFKNNYQTEKVFKEGIYVVASMDVQDENNESSLYVLSNKVPLTLDLLKYFGSENPFDFNSIDLKNLKDMNLLNINAVNTITHQIIKSQHQEESKAGLIQPIFFRSTPVSNIIIHPDVIETICINLDEYKSKVKSFTMQIEGVAFHEIGRTSSGVLFKVIGKSLPRAVDSGSYYILNEENELVSSGKYNYE